MMAWEPYTLAQLNPEGMAALMELIATTGSAVAAGANAAAGALDVVAALLVDIADPMAATLLAMRAAIDEFISDTYATGIYFYVDPGPLTGGGPDGMDGFMLRLAQSFVDAGDADRPAFSGSAAVSGLLLVGGAPSLPELAPLYALLGELFGVQSFIAAAETLLKGALSEQDYPDQVAAAMSVPPDWRFTTVGDLITPLARLQDILGVVRDMFRPAESMAAFIEDIAAALEEKAATLEAIADEVEALAKTLALLTGSGLYAMAASGKGSAGWLATAEAAADRPELAYVVGIAIVGGGPAMAGLLSLLGLNA